MFLIEAHTLTSFSLLLYPIFSFLILFYFSYLDISGMESNHVV